MRGELLRGNEFSGEKVRLVSRRQQADRFARGDLTVVISVSRKFRLASSIGNCLPSHSGAGEFHTQVNCLYPRSVFPVLFGCRRIPNRTYHCSRVHSDVALMNRSGAIRVGVAAFSSFLGGTLVVCAPTPQSNAKAASAVSTAPFNFTSEPVKSWATLQPLPLASPRLPGSPSLHATPSDMIASVFPSLIKVVGAIGERRIGGGSGFVISRTGLVCTNAHVVSALINAGCTELLAVFNDGRVVVLEPLASDFDADIAVAQLMPVTRPGSPPNEFPYLSFARSASLRRGEPIAVCGAPLGGPLVPSLGSSAGDRYVSDDEHMYSALHGRGDWNLLQVDAPMSSGSSGGPIVNKDGDCVGVSVMVQTTGGFGVGAIHFGVASDQVHAVLNSLLVNGHVTRPTIGLVTIVVDSHMAEREFDNSRVSLLPPGAPAGLVVAKAIINLPGYKAGIRDGDVVTHIGGSPATRAGDMFRAIGPVFQAGHTVNVRVWRPRGAGKGGDSLEFAINPAPKDQHTHKRSLFFSGASTTPEHILQGRK